MKSIDRNSRNNGEAGFGVIEIAIVVAIGAVIISMAVVAFGRAAKSYEMSQKAQNIVWQIERARSIAIKYNQTLTLGFSKQSRTLGFTCTDCAGAKSELPAMRLPEGVTLSAYPTLTLKGNGTITSTSQTLRLADGSGRYVDIAINHSGRVTAGDVVSEE